MLLTSKWGRIKFPVHWNSLQTDSRIRMVVQCLNSILPVIRPGAYDQGPSCQSGNRQTDDRKINLNRAHPIYLIGFEVKKTFVVMMWLTLII